MDDTTNDSGSGDSSGSSGNLLNGLLSFANQGSQIYKNIIGGSSPTAPATPKATAPAATTSTWQQYLPWAIGGVVLLVVVGLIFRGK
jgi:hypothetical protein